MRREQKNTQYDPEIIPGADHARKRSEEDILIEAEAERYLALYRTREL
jgi:hypothetical protein